MVNISTMKKEELLREGATLAKVPREGLNRDKDKIKEYELKKGECRWAVKAEVTTNRKEQKRH